MNIPDSIEKVEGWRAFTFKGDVLGPTNVGRNWTPGENEALCFSGIQPQKALKNGPNGLEEVTFLDHGPIPEPACGCGFWLLAEPSAVLERFSSSYASNVAMGSGLWVSPTATWSITGAPQRSAPFVLGKVAGWGRVIVADKGWRVQYAEITELLTVKARSFAAPDAVELLASAYEVPCTTLKLPRKDALRRKQEQDQLRNEFLASFRAKSLSAAIKFTDAT